MADCEHPTYRALPEMIKVVEGGLVGAGDGTLGGRGGGDSAARLNVRRQSQDYVVDRDETAIPDPQPDCDSYSEGDMLLVARIRWCGAVVGLQKA